MVTRVARRLSRFADWQILGSARACRPRPSEPVAGGVIRGRERTTPDPTPRTVAPVISVTLVSLLIQPDIIALQSREEKKHVRK